MAQHTDNIPPAKYAELVAQASALDADSPFVWKAVLKEALAENGLTQKRVGIVAARAREEAGNYVRVRGADLNPEAALISSSLKKRLTPWAERLREEGFGKREAPFKDEAEAADWIEEQSALDREQRVEERLSPADAMKEIRRLADLAGLEVRPKVRFLKYGRPDDEHDKSVGVEAGTFLDMLARETNRVSEETAFQADVLTAFVLTDLTPQISRVRGTEVQKLCDVPGDRIQSRWITLRFNAADVSYPEVRKLYNEVRRYFGATDANLLKWEEAEFLLLVDSMGGPPEDDKMRFWEEVLRRWKENPAHKYAALNSWRAARNKFEKLDKRKNVRGLWTPNPHSRRRRSAAI
ncbi:MAG: hypothetical protein M3118_01735 [Actinomycetota bacterium]|nr:hypothetical protein [Actinomycetota bacterium]